MQGKFDTSKTTKDEVTTGNQKDNGLAITAYTPTAQEQQLNAMEMNNLQGGSFNNLLNALLTGQDLPGKYGSMGISDQMAGEMAQKSVRDILPSFQNSGIMDSGVAANIAGNVAGNTRMNTAQYNINNRMNLLGMGLQGQGIYNQQSSLLGQRLAGLRRSTTANTNQRVFDSNTRGTGTTTGTGFGIGYGTYGGV